MSTAHTSLTPLKIEDHTEQYGREEDGHFSIYVRESASERPNAKVMTTQWRPTVEQLAELNAGASIFLGIETYVEARHPPIMLTVASIAPVLEVNPNVEEL
jgi:hypothetical protein